MTKEKRCGNCEHYRVGQGNYGAGKCISKESHKRNKNFVLTSELCCKFKQKKGD